MGVHLNPYLHFSDQAADALAFYGDVFGATPSIMTFGDMGMEGPDATKVMHGQIETDQVTLMCADTPQHMTAAPRGGGISVSLSGDDDDRLRGWWQKLSNGGEVETPLEKQMWGDEFGQCTDRFGIQWLVNISGSAV